MQRSDTKRKKKKTKLHNLGLCSRQGNLIVDRKGLWKVEQLKLKHTHTGNTFRQYRLGKHNEEKPFTYDKNQSF